MAERLLAHLPFDWVPTWVNNWLARWVWAEQRNGEED